MEPTEVEKLEQARRRTVSAITAYAHAKHTLEEVRKDKFIRPEIIQQAAQEFRAKERVMKEMIDMEVAVITEVALAQVNKPASD